MRVPGTSKLRPAATRPLATLQSSSSVGNRAALIKPPEKSYYHHRLARLVALHTLDTTLHVCAMTVRVKRALHEERGHATDVALDNGDIAYPYSTWVVDRTWRPGGPRQLSFHRSRPATWRSLTVGSV